MSRLRESKYRWCPRTTRLRIRYYSGNAEGFYSPKFTDAEKATLDARIREIKGGLA